jgi:hypothetical protein
LVVDRGRSRGAKAIFLAKAAKLAKAIQSQMLKCGARFQQGTDVAEKVLETVRESSRKHVLKILTGLCDLGALGERLAFS